MKRLRTCVFPCAGWGTRFLPATKAIPKEMIPLIDKPVIQYGVEEALASGLDRIIIITSRGKEAIVDHFDRNHELERSLSDRSKHDLLDLMHEVSSMAEIVAVRQKEVRGLGHAIGCARGAVDDEPFAVSLPDDVILADPPCLAQMAKVYAETGRPVIALMEVPPTETSRYGIVGGEAIGDRRFRITEMVEKPQKNPPSNLAIIGRYILTPEIFEALDETAAGSGGEIQITDAIRKLMASGEVYGYLFDGTRYDAGEKLGYLRATVEYALRHPKFGEEFRAYLKSIV